MNALPGIKSADYVPQDAMSLWWMGDPSHPVRIGTIHLVMSGQGISLFYDDAWIRNGFALSEDLPLHAMEFMPAAKERAAGAVEDARPDRWGERVIRFLDRPARLSILEFLLFAGHDRFGALGVSVDMLQYVPIQSHALPALDEVSAIEEVVRSIEAGTPVPPHLRRLVAPGTTMGGAKPKALAMIDGHPWVVKFKDHEEVVDGPLVEHATMTLAAKAGIRVAETRAIDLGARRGHAVAVRRFDREGEARIHALSAEVALRAAGEAMGYPELAQLLRRRGSMDVAQLHMRELFTRMVFNILVDNTDDHEKNHAVLIKDGASYGLSPAFDVLPTLQSLGYQQMRVGKNDHDATLDNALSMHAQFGLDLKQAEGLCGAVARVVDGWRGHFAACGVVERDITELGRHIDRPALLHQREAWRGKRQP